jgi:hypothetical protein
MAHQPPHDRVTRQPRYRSGDENADANSAREPLTARQRRTRVLVIAIVAAVVLAILVLHLTGALGAGTNG